ncbi:hypothetical protein WN944_025566 [Citrus x changshan-huyou]|uniref:Uncharacterized protein n=1 Tax=Citrus x changshan-huyou TaxID=2935761 RepID=A0AAP0QGS9_9ROSI
MAVELKDLRINNENESRKKKFRESLVGDMNVDWIDYERQEGFEIFRPNVLSSTTFCFYWVNLYLLLGNPTVSVLPSSDDGEDGAWVVLTEKAGIWAIPEKAIVLGGVEPPERSLSRKGSSNERSVLEERRNFTLAGPRRVSSDAWAARDRQKAVSTGIARRSAQDEESEALLGHLFHDFLLSGQVDGSFEKLQNSGAFERDGETSVFFRTSKAIVDTLAKHWTTTRGAEILSMVSSQLKDKQQEHEKFLQFLALSKRH